MVLSGRVPKRERKRLRRNWPPEDLARLRAWAQEGRHYSVSGESWSQLHGLKERRKEVWLEDRKREAPRFEQETIDERTPTGSRSTVRDVLPPIFAKLKGDEQQKRDLLEKYDTFLDKSRFLSFEPEVKRLHSRIPLSLRTPDANQIVREKLHEIEGAKSLVQRFEWLPNVVRQLGSGSMLVGKEA